MRIATKSVRQWHMLSMCLWACHCTCLFKCQSHTSANTSCNCSHPSNWLTSPYHAQNTMCISCTRHPLQWLECDVAMWSERHKDGLSKHRHHPKIIHVTEHGGVCIKKKAWWDQSKKRYTTRGGHVHQVPATWPMWSWHCCTSQHPVALKRIGNLCGEGAVRHNVTW